MYDVATRTFERLADFGEWPVFLPDDRRVLFVAGGEGFYVLDTRTKTAAGEDLLGCRATSSARRGSRATGPRCTIRGGDTEADIWLVTLR